MNPAEAVEGEDLRRDDRDLVGVGEKAPRARLAARRVPERLELLRWRRALARSAEQQCRGATLARWRGVAFT